MIECQITNDQNTGDKIMAFKISMTEFLTNKSIMDLLKDNIYNRITSEIAEDYLKKNKETIIARIDTQELANLIKNKISLEIIQDFKKKEEIQKIEKPFCALHCPSQRANLLGKDLKITKNDKPVDPYLCRYRQQYRCRLIDR